MRVAIFALALAHAVASSAQINVGNEIVSDPLRGGILPLLFAQPAASLAADRTGVAIAWVDGTPETDRIFVARLGASGRFTNVRQIPISTAGTVFQASPSLAPSPDGDGFVLAWLELEQIIPSSVPSRARPVYCRLDAALTPSAPTVMFPAITPLAPAIARTKGDTVWVTANGWVWKLSNDGTLNFPTAAIAASDMTIATDVPQLIGSSSRSGATCDFFRCPPGFTPHPCPAICVMPFANYTLSFTSLNGVAQSTTFSFANDAQPAIGSNGREVLVAWFRGSKDGGGDVAASRVALTDLQSFVNASGRPAVLAALPPDSGATRPAIATDGERYVVVWRIARTPLDHDVVGVVIDSDGKLTPLSIAASSADEIDPTVVYAGEGTFVVAYEKHNGTERRIAARGLVFGRRRAAR